MKKAFAIVKFALLITLVIGAPLLIYFLHPEVIAYFKSLESINELLNERKDMLLPLFFVLQIFQVVVSVIPAQAVQIAAGYAYNFWIAYIVSITGLLAGSVITYFIAKLLGRDALRLIFGEERIGKFVDRLNSKKAYIALFIIFLIPGLPKDLFAYAAGISQMNALAFFAISAIARTPALMASNMFGGMLRSHSYVGMIILGAIIAVIFILGIKYHSKLSDLVDRLYDRYVSRNRAGN
jgi:uncharacterized membrane protein YdjX (TVP38/TMEM64 family)